MMEATSKKDVTSMVESMINDANERNGKLLFIKYSNTFTIKYEDILVASNNNETTVQILYHASGADGGAGRHAFAHSEKYRGRAHIYLCAAAGLCRAQAGAGAYQRR